MHPYLGGAAAPQTPVHCGLKGKRTVSNNSLFKSFSCRSQLDMEQLDHRRPIQAHVARVSQFFRKETIILQQLLFDLKSIAKMNNN